ncbi:uncharacterized protein VDAG_04296 [Verticillium dahliae VdLs.17]|uniref:Uncharacterized protein n=1 Tax=Verticillium dahliae (strain VdLs.17 / ATCC MYA-4575 / FGSC 10137) TaxID=498257 RepID=G2X1X2_VERDV|nr:uncharacterized protein VDAG_04296 [Verticillium dahliae VdLs.17]EGY22858.1 hypothetical protein VDAG_04296 [Verticillium dahliae VdLs.17]
MIDSGPRDWDEQSYAHDERPLFPRAAEDRFENQMMQAEDAKLVSARRRPGRQADGPTSSRPVSVYDVASPSAVS